MKRHPVLAALLLVALLRANVAADFQFAWFSDTHVSEHKGKADLKAAVADVNSLTDIAFVIVSGDLTELDIDGYLDTTKIILDKLDVPYYVIPGNHDTKWSASGTVKFHTLFGKDKFNFEFGGLRFIGFHQGPLPRMGDGLVAPEDLRWLRWQLTSLPDTEQPLILVTHYPLDSSVSNWFEVFELLNGFNVQAILHGHGHRNRRRAYAGIPGIMGRSTLRAGTETGGYNIVTVTADSLVFRERRTDEQTYPAWTRLAIEKRIYSLCPDSIDFPDFGINDRYGQVTIDWSRSVGWALAAPPACDGKLVVVTNSGGYVEALDLNTGELIWRFRAAGAIFSAPAIAKKRVVFASVDSSIYCLRLPTGRVAWRYKTGAPVVATPRIAARTVYIGGSDHIFRALRLRDGKLIWQYSPVHGFVETRPCLNNEHVIFGAWDENLYALNRRSGTLEWRWSDGREGVLYSPAAVWPVAAQGKVFIAAPDRFLSCIDESTGATLWRSGRFKVRETIGISENADRIFARTMRDTVLAFDPAIEQFQTEWVVSAGYGYDIDPSMPVEKEGLLFFGTKNGCVYALDSASGQLEWAHRVGVGLVNTVVALDRHRVIVTTMEGKVVRLTVP